MMSMNKREFLRFLGLSALGAGLTPVTEAEAEAHGEPAKRTGKRWAMVIDLRKDTDWGPVIAACHRSHNVPDFVHNPDPAVNNPRHEIKWIWLEPYKNAFDLTDADEQFIAENIRQAKLPVLCNHCDNPPCVRACPTKATFKRPDGIVAMDFHRCIGCRFCMAACPYGSRSFNLKDPRLGFKDPQAKGGWKAPNPEFPTRQKGVVEKCNFCAERLALGLKPACVEACASGAIAFGDLNDPHEAEEGGVLWLLRHNFALKRKPELGTLPMVYYLV
jgi:molybdopterin-containing oxidoreductase family iron-sulfur binding subunit